MQVFTQKAHDIATEGQLIAMIGEQFVECGLKIAGRAMEVVEVGGLDGFGGDGEGEGGGEGDGDEEGDGERDGDGDGKVRRGDGKRDGTGDGKGLLLGSVQDGGYGHGKGRCEGNESGRVIENVDDKENGTGYKRRGKQKRKGRKKQRATASDLETDSSDPDL